MTTIQAGEFWVANIPFTSGGDSKKRPILVLWLDGNDVVTQVAGYQIQIYYFRRSQTPK